eukprot:scaffold297_cov108-Isochrysis_galbana.AAC.19
MPRGKQVLELALQLGGRDQRGGLQLGLDIDAQRLEHAGCRLERLEHRNHLGVLREELRGDEGQRTGIEPEHEGGRLANDRGHDGGRALLEELGRHGRGVEAAVRLLERTGLEPRRRGRQPELGALGPQQAEHDLEVVRGRLEREKGLLLGRLGSRVVVERRQPVLGARLDELARPVGVQSLALEDGFDGRRAEPVLLGRRLGTAEDLLGPCGQHGKALPLGGRAGRQPALHAQHGALHVDDLGQRAGRIELLPERLKKVKGAGARLGLGGGHGHVRWLRATQKGLPAAALGSGRVRAKVGEHLEKRRLGGRLVQLLPREQHLKHPQHQHEGGVGVLGARGSGLVGLAALEHVDQCLLVVGLLMRRSDLRGAPQLLVQPLQSLPEGEEHRLERRQQRGAGHHAQLHARDVLHRRRGGACCRPAPPAAAAADGRLDLVVGLLQQKVDGAGGQLDGIYRHSLIERVHLLAHVAGAVGEDE